MCRDVFREPDEDRQAYVRRYIRRIRQQWTSLEPALQDHVVDHLVSSDYPAARDAFTAMAAAAGWRCRWIWRGSHQAEALLALQAEAAAAR